MNLKLKKYASQAEEEIQNSMEWLISGIDIQQRRIELRSEINEISASIVIRALIRMSEISREPIELLLSSSGGSVSQGLAIYDYIRHCPCDIKIIASGEVMSMGFIIFLAGDIRLALPNTSFMMHSIAYGGIVESKIVKHHEVDVNEAKRLNNILLEIMGERTKRNKKWWYRNVILQDKYFNVAEATELGIIKTATNTQQAIKKSAKKVLKKGAKKNVK